MTNVIPPTRIFVYPSLMYLNLQPSTKLSNMLADFKLCMSNCKPLKIPTPRPFNPFLLTKLPYAINGFIDKNILLMVLLTSTKHVWSPKDILNLKVSTTSILSHWSPKSLLSVLSWLLLLSKTGIYNNSTSTMLSFMGI